jgi:hypothetical protein
MGYFLGSVLVILFCRFVISRHCNKISRDVHQLCLAHRQFAVVFSSFRNNQFISLLCFLVLDELRRKTLHLVNSFQMLFLKSGELILECEPRRYGARIGGTVGTGSVLSSTVAAFHCKRPGFLNSLRFPRHLAAEVYLQHVLLVPYLQYTYKYSSS